MAKGLQSALRRGLYPEISILGSVRRGFGRIVETYCRTIRLSPGKSIITAKWSHRPFQESPRPNCNEKHKYAEKIMAAEILYGLLGNIVGAIPEFSCAASTVLHKRSKNQNSKKGTFLNSVPSSAVRLTRNPGRPMLHPHFTNSPSMF